MVFYADVWMCSTMQNLYEADFYLWTQLQAQALRLSAGEVSNSPLDFENLAEEIESLGRSQLEEAESFAFQIMVHLLMLACSPAVRPRAKWRTEVRSFRRRLNKRLDMSPSLTRKLRADHSSRFSEALGEARRRLEDFGEFDRARPAYEGWVVREIKFDEVLEDELYPSQSSPEMLRESA